MVMPIHLNGRTLDADAVNAVEVSGTPEEPRLVVHTRGGETETLTGDDARALLVFLRKHRAD